MKKYLIILAISLLPRGVNAQWTINNVSFSAHNLVPLTFTYNTVEELLEQKVLTNAIRLDLCINNKGCNVTARVIYPTAPGQAPPAWLSKTWINDNSPDAQIPSNISVLGITDNLLFMQPSDGLNTAKNYSYYYNLNLAPVTTFIDNGMYNFKILYTMTLL